jgi:hypothetical protein
VDASLDGAKIDNRYLDGKYEPWNAVRERLENGLSADASLSI